MPLDPEETATIVTSRAIRAGHEEDFERWAAELDRLARAEPGFRASIRLGQTAGFQHLLFRFDDRGAAEAWRNSPAFVAHAAMADDYSTALTRSVPATPSASELPSDASASKWKRFMTMAADGLPGPAGRQPERAHGGEGGPAPATAPSSLLLTATLQWVILPRLQRHTRFWLLQDGSGHLRT
jgi:heme-degrading monooxygenase HmoA